MADTLAFRLTVEGDREVIAKLDAVGAKGEQVGQKSGEAFKKGAEGSKEFEGDLRSLVSLFDEFERGQRGSFFATIGEKFKEGIGGANGFAIAVTALAGAFLGLAVKGAEMASQIKEASIRVGTS